MAAGRQPQDQLAAVADEPSRDRDQAPPQGGDHGFANAALASNAAELHVETDIESGLRWGELTELRPRDLDFGSGVLTVSRVVAELSPQFHPGGRRFLVEDYPKDKEHRRLKLSGQITAKLRAFIDANGIGRDDLIFTMPAKSTAVARTPGTEPSGVRPVKISRAASAQWKPTGTSPVGGSAPMSGSQLLKPPTCRGLSQCTGCGTRTPPGCK